MRTSEYFREHFGILGRRIGAYRNFGQSGITYYELKKTVEELDWLAKR